MRLLITTDTVGGVWSFTCNLAGELLKRGHTVSLVSFGRVPSAAQIQWVTTQQGAFGDDFQFTASDVPLEWMQNNEDSFSAGEPVLASAAQQLNPDLLLSNQFCFCATSLAIPRIAVAHSDVLSWAEACKPSALEPTPWLERYTSLVQQGLSNANALIAPTRWMLDALAVNFSLPSNARIIPNGVPPPDTQGSGPRYHRAITAGRLWDEAKGLDLLQQADLPCPVIIAGDLSSPEGAASRSTPPNLTSVGPLPTTELHDLFAQSAMYLCTSRYEPFGLAPLEAALCGCAVLARDIPSLHEVWADDALYFANAAELTSQLRYLTSNPSALAAAQTRSFIRAQQYTVERMTDRYIAACDSVLQRSRAMPHVA